MLLEKNGPDRLIQGCHRTSICKKKKKGSAVKQSSIKWDTLVYKELLKFNNNKQPD